MGKKFTGTVDRVYDGDTFKTKKGHIVRLANVNAPETHQSGGSTATRRLAYLIANKKVSVTQVGTHGNRKVGIVRVGRKNVNTQMRRWGY